MEAVVAIQEIDALDPANNVLTLSTGTRVEVKPLRTREFFKFLRIITRGARPAMVDLSLFNLGEDVDISEFTGKLLGTMLLSIPEAEDEAVDFINAMVQPVGLIERPRGLKLSKLDNERNMELWTRVYTDLDNPELDDTVSIIETVVKAEAADIQALGKRLVAMFKMAQKAGQLKPSHDSTTQDRNSSADYPERSTSLRLNTDGTTTTSGGSLFVDSGSASPQYANVATLTVGTETSG